MIVEGDPVLGYAVVDLETTGLHPGRHDRVVEIAIVNINHDGTITAEWSSLVNPQRDVGPTHIHGIKASDVYAAPCFDQIASHVARLLRERILIAHNLSFDARFLSAEFHRIGINLPIEAAHGLCTMRLAARYLPSSGRSLSSCCLSAGISITNAHSALGDARATSQLFAHYLANAGQPPPWAKLYQYTTADSWPELTSGGASATASLPRKAAFIPADGDWINRLVARLPRVLDPPNADPYLATLDMALLDRHLSLHEQDALVALAENLQLTRVQIHTLHHEYLTALAVEAWADGVVTRDELTDLIHVATLLGLHQTDVDRALIDAAAENPRRPECRPVFRLHIGDRVALTGDMELPREVWTQRAELAGLAVGGVTKTTRVLVAADPDTLSGKARKARDYGIPVIGESAVSPPCLSAPVNAAEPPRPMLWCSCCIQQFSKY